MQKIVIVVLLSVFAVCLARPADQPEDNVSSTVGVLYNEEIVVESSLNIRTKDKTRQKRQFGGFGQSSALANANSHNQYHGPGGFGGSSGMGQAQAFNAQGPLGGFGASAANTATQGFHAGQGGIQGGAGMSGSQTYDLPGGKHINLAYGQSYDSNNGRVTGGGSNSLTYTK